jgi:phospholipid/cholesterol/gamma-HCH transport system substrate-binding protein
MNLLRNEIRTGLLVVITLAVLVAVLLYLGAPGVFVPQHTYRIFFENAAGIKPGGQVLLAGRKIGQVRALYSPVPDKDRPTPKMETLIEVEVDRDAKIYNKVRAQITSTTLLGEMVIDFSNGEEASGLAPDGTNFLGERAATLSEAVPAVLERIDPALAKITDTLDSLQKTSDNLTRMTSEGADLPIALSEFRKFGANLDEISGPESSLRLALKNIETLTSENGKLGKSLDHISELLGPESSLSRTLQNTERFTASLTNTRDIEVTLGNFRTASDTLNRTIANLGTQFTAIGTNLEQATDTVKRQPWRLVWPTTKRYNEPAATPIPVRRATLVKKAPSHR